MKKILVLIPAFNAEKTISSLIDQISAFIARKDILVIDDGSTDKTYQLARESGANCLQHKKNKGKGEALKTGFEYALEQGYSGVITLDADLQHDPKFIPQFIKKAESDIDTGRVQNGSRWTGCPTYEESINFVGGAPSPAKHVRVGVPQSGTSPANILIGTRNIRLKTMPFSRWLTNNVTSIIVSILGDTKVRDSQSGYRYISTEVLRSFKLSTKKYELESEILIKAGRKGFKIAPMPISTIYHGSKSFINPLVDTGRFIKLMWKSLFW
ncbi:MAG: glycosyltransferase family 2 protein [candidate division Zixibacteria bacterium]|nr:glycosyltransferase family 2 protein [candidate division Zixibacteria bacterium]